jgi:hypothetical protein
MVATEIFMNYLMGVTGITIIVLLYIGFSVFRMKRWLKKQLAAENQYVQQYPNQNY